jgi:uncharacterized protein (DUF885 family)
MGVGFARSLCICLILVFAITQEPDKAFALWNENVKGQDDIAYREITRVIYWPGQSLSYKIGARKIEEFKSRLHVTDSTIKKFHSVFLSFSAEPLEVIEKNIVEAYNAR